MLKVRAKNSSPTTTERAVTMIPVKAALALSTRSATKYELAEATKALTKSSSRKAANLSKKGLVTNAALEAEFQAEKIKLTIPKNPNNANRADLLAQYNYVKRLNQSAGLNSRKAAAVYQRDMRSNRFEYLTRRDNAMAKLDRARTIAEYKSDVKLIADRAARRYKKLVLQGFSTPAMARYKEIADMSDDTKAQAHRKLTALKRLFNGGMNTFDPEGASDFEKKQNEIFGKNYAKLDGEQRTALWNEAKRIGEQMGWDSSQVREGVSGMVEGVASFSFFRNAHGRLEATIGQGKQDLLALTSQKIRDSRNNGIHIDHYKQAVAASSVLGEKVGTTVNQRHTQIMRNTTFKERHASPFFNQEAMIHNYNEEPYRRVF